MKKLLLMIALFGFSNSISTTTFATENWKGHTETSPVEVGVLTGLSIFGTQTGWGTLLNAAYLIQPKGWLDDIDNRIWVEMEAGPAFFTAPTGSTGTAFQYSVHGRWDFTYNEYWTAYALGGFSGYSLPVYLGKTFSFHPRFGVGVEYQTKTPLMFRGEVSAEFMGAGIALNF